MERNRMKALSLKRARLTARATAASEKPSDAKATERSVLVGDGRDNGKGPPKEKRLVDTKAGFFIEEDEGGGTEDGEERNLVSLPAPITKPDRPECEECGEAVAESFLLRTFDLSVCDSCKDTEKEGKHELITKTDAKSTFLLKDGDLERRGEKPLGFIVRKNPHNPRWGDMKLYLRSQVEELALAVWGSEEALERAHEERDGRREAAKRKKFNKQIKALRMQVRGSLYKKDLGGHQHEFGEEGYDEEEDEYFKTCKTCDYTARYEKM